MSFDSTFNWLAFSSRITYTCVAGFTPTGQSFGTTSICGNGVCIDEVGGYTCNCHEGYNATVEENDTVCDIIDCGNYSVSNGTVSPLKLVFNDEAVVTCFPGYTLTGGVKCGSDGEFVAVPSSPSLFATKLRRSSTS